MAYVAERKAGFSSRHKGPESIIEQNRNRVATRQYALECLEGHQFGIDGKRRGLREPEDRDWTIFRSNYYLKCYPLNALRGPL